MDFCDKKDQENGECYQAHEITSSSQEFCRLLDYKVYPFDECYDGIPKAQIIPLSKNRLNKEGKKHFRENGYKRTKN